MIQMVGNDGSDFLTRKRQLCKCVICFGFCCQLSIGVSPSRLPLPEDHNCIGQDKERRIRGERGGPRDPARKMNVHKQRRKGKGNEGGMGFEKKSRQPCRLHCYRKWNAIMLRKQESKWKQMCLFKLTHMHNHYKHTHTCCIYYIHNMQWQPILYLVSLSHSPVNFRSFVWIESDPLLYIATQRQDSKQQHKAPSVSYFIAPHTGVCSLFSLFPH